MNHCIRQPYPNELYHHGIKGQKWGVRRYQNPDGSLTPEGKEHFKKRDERGLETEWYARNQEYAKTGNRRDMLPDKGNLGGHKIPGPQWYTDERGRLISLQAYSDGTIAAVNKDTPPEKTRVYFLDDETAKRLMDDFNKDEYDRQDRMNQNQMANARKNMAYRKSTSHRYDTDFNGKVSVKEAIKGVSKDAAKAAKRIMSKISDFIK